MKTVTLAGGTMRQRSVAHISQQPSLAEEGRGFNSAEKRYLDSIPFHSPESSSRQTLQRVSSHQGRYPLVPAGFQPNTVHLTVCAVFCSH